MIAAIFHCVDKLYQPGSVCSVCWLICVLGAQRSGRHDKDFMIHDVAGDMWEMTIYYGNIKVLDLPCPNNL